MGFVESLKAAYFSLEERYYKFADGLQAKGIRIYDWFIKPVESMRIPSFPLFVLLVTLVVAGALVLLLTLSGTGARSLEVTVQSDGVALDGARIQILHDNKVIAEKNATGGTAFFDGLPEGELTVAVNADGIATTRRSVNAGQSTLLVNVGPGGTGQTADRESLQVHVEDAQTSQSLSGAVVSFNSVKGSGQRTTDANGDVVLSKAALTNLRVSLAGYQPDVRTVRDGGRVIIALKPVGGSLFTIPESISENNWTTQLESNGQVVVRIDNGSAPVDGHVALYATQGTKIGAQETLEASASFRAPFGQTVYPVVNAPGYALYDGEFAAQAVTDVTEFRVTLASAEAAQDTTVRAVDSQGNALHMHAKVLKEPAVELADFQGELWELKVVPGDYYLWVSSDGYLSATEKLVAGKNHVITLQKASVFNAASLEALVQDEFGSALSGASVFLIRDAKLFSDAKTTDAQGKTVFENVALGQATLVAHFGGKSANKSVDIAVGGVTAHLTLTIHQATLNVSVTNAADGTTLEADVSVDTVLGNAACHGSTCAFQTPSQTEAVISVSANGFATAIQSVVLADGETRELPVALLPDAAARGTAVSVSSVRNATGDRVQTLTPGGEYIVSFALSAAPASTAQQMHVRIGSDDALIVEHTAADLVNRSILYSGNCDDLLPENTFSEDGYRWMDLGFETAAERELFFVIRLKPTARSNQVLTLEYATTTQAGQITARDPPDETPTPCDQKTRAYSIPIAGSALGTGTGGGSQASPTPDPSIPPGSSNVLPEGKYFTPQVGIAYNPATGKVEADVEEIVLQVDPIYPRDTVPLHFDQSRCQIAATIESSQPRCFSLSSDSLTFRTREFEPSCDSRVSANRVVLAQDSAKLVLQAICAGVESQTKVPIRIEAQEAQSLSTAPRQLDQGERTAKLLYAVNQLQAGTRTLVPSGAAGTISVGSPSATAMSWSGPGTLTLLEGDQAIGEWTYASGTAFFSGIGTVGSRVDAASDYLSCGQGWCTAKAALQAISFFKKEAQKTALATAFRRADVPLNEYPTPTPEPTPTPSPSPSPSPGASASPSPTPPADASPTPPASSEPATLNLNEAAIAQNGVSAQLVDVTETANGVVASFFIKNGQGAIVDGIDLLAGESYNQNGIVITVTSLDLMAKTVTLTVSSGTASTTAQSVLEFAGQNEPFTFVTVMQLGQDADKVLALSDFTVQRPPGCSAGQPAVYELRATTADGKNFQYAAATLSLTNNLDTPGNQVALCGFLYADKKTIQGAPPTTSGTGSTSQPGSPSTGPAQPGFDPLMLASLLNPSAMSLLNPETTGNPVAIDSHFAQAQGLAEQCQTLSKQVADNTKSCPRRDAILDNRKMTGEQVNLNNLEQSLGGTGELLKQQQVANAKKKAYQTAIQTEQTKYSAIGTAIQSLPATCRVPASPSTQTNAPEIKINRDIITETSRSNIQTCNPASTYGTCGTSPCQCASHQSCTPTSDAVASHISAFTQLKTATTAYDTELEKYKKLKDELTRTGKACDSAEKACKSVGGSQPSSTTEQPPSKSFVQNAEFGCYVLGPTERGGQDALITQKTTQYAAKDLDFGQILSMVPFGGSNLTDGIAGLPGGGSNATDNAIAAPYVPASLAEFEPALSFTSTAALATANTKTTTATASPASQAQGYGCQPLCEPKAACAEVFLQGPQLTVQVHYGLTMDCREKITSAQAQAMRVAYKSPSAYNSQLSPFAGVALFGGQQSCNGAKAAFNANQPGGPGGFQQVSQQLVNALKPQSQDGAQASPSPSPAPAGGTGTDGTQQLLEIGIIIDQTGVLTTAASVQAGQAFRLNVDKSRESANTIFSCTFTAPQLGVSDLVPQAGLLKEISGKAAGTYEYYCNEKPQKKGTLTIS